MENNTNNIQPQDTTQIHPLVDTIPKILSQDSTALSVQDTVISEDTVPAPDIKQYTIQEALQIFEKEQQHREKIDSIEKASITESVQQINVPQNNIPVFEPDSSDIFIAINENQGIKPLFFYNMWKHSNENKLYNNHLFISSEKTTGKEANHSGTGVPAKNRDNYQSHDEISSVWNDWVLGIIIFSFILLVWINLFYKKVISATFKSIFNYQVSNNLFLDKGTLTKTASSILDFVFYLNAGLFIYLSTKHYNIILVKPEGIKAFLLFSTFVFIVYSLRSIIGKIAGYVSITKKIFSEYVHNIFIYTRASGLVLLPFLIAIPYTDHRLTPVAIFAGTGIIILGHILQIIRGIKIFTLRKVSVLYLFLYICTLEIIPVLVFFKYLNVFLTT